MGREFKVIKELATISATAVEFAAVNRIICQQIPSLDFRREYDSLISDIKATYQVVLDILQPVADITAPEAFNSQFTNTYNWYKEHYPAALSEPRVYAEVTFEKYLQFRKRKEVKTSFPMLKGVFARLHDLIDKWIDNDIWLAMSIDLMLKQLSICLDDVADTFKSDPEEAYALYQACAGGFATYLGIVSGAVKELPHVSSDSSGEVIYSSNASTISP